MGALAARYVIQKYYSNTFSEMSSFFGNIHHPFADRAPLLYDYLSSHFFPFPEYLATSGALNRIVISFAMSHEL